MIKDIIRETIKHDLGVDNFILLTPKNPEHGDYAFFMEHGAWSMKHEKLLTNPLFEKVEQRGNFINLFLKTEVLINEIKNIIALQNQYGSQQIKSPKKINLEYGQPNTHKLPHIGHLFSYIYGESLARLLSFAGNDIFRCNYQGDIGLHVAKCLYQVQKTKLKVQNLNTLEEKIQFLQQCYQEGSQLYEKDEIVRKEIDEINKKIYQNDPSIVELWQKTRQWSLDYYRKFEEKLGINYNQYYFESETAPVGKKLVMKYVPRVFEESDGAVIFRGEKYGLHTRVFINHFGNPTYEAKDVGLIDLKQKDWPFEKAVLTTASEQNAYYKVVKKAIELVFPDLKGKIEHVGFGMIDLKGGKMSSRTGQIISAINLVAEIENQVAMLIDKKGKTFQEITTISKIVSMAAIKYSFLKSEAKKNMFFDIKESISTKGNSGPYLLYTYARCMSVLDKAASVIASEAKQSQRDRHVALAPRDDNVFQEELALLRTFFRFPEVVDEAAKKYAPHLVTTYLFDLAQKYNLFYEKLPILKADGSTKQFRLMITAATAQLLKNGLNLLGVDVLDKI